MKCAPEIPYERKLEVQRIELRRPRAPVLPTSLCELWFLCSSVRCVALPSLDASFPRISFCMTQDFNSGEVISSACGKKVLSISFNFDKLLK